MYTHTLLLVDSSSKTEQEIRTAFADESIEVVVVENGYLALDRIETHRPDVVLASATAFGVDGYGLAHYVSQRPYLSNVAVLLLAAEASTIDTLRIKESGARGFVQQPIAPGIVVARVKEALQLSEPALPQVDVLGQLTTAFDAIDASMTSNAPDGRAHPGGNPITPEVLARIVSDAVTHAIAAYEQARGLAPTSAPSATIASGRRLTGVPPSPWQKEQQRLQRDLGINDIEFEPAPEVVYNNLAAQMGVNEFSFDDAPPDPLAPAAAPAAQPEAERSPQRDPQRTAGSAPPPLPRKSRAD